MRVTTNHLHYSVTGMLKKFRYCAAETVIRNCCVKWQRSNTSSQTKWSTLTLYHKRSQSMEVPIIVYSSKTKTPNKNYISSQRQNNNWLKKSPFSKENEEYEEKCQNTSLCQRTQEEYSRRKFREKFEEINFGFTSPGTPQKNGVIDQ